MLKSKMNISCNEEECGRGEVIQIIGKRLITHDDHEDEKMAGNWQATE